MADVLTILGVAFASNLDNLGTGAAYGIAGITVQPLANLWIALLTCAATLISVAAGHAAAHIMPPTVAGPLSAAALCGIGIWTLIGSIREHRSAPRDGSPTLVGVLNDPESADIDASRTIDLREATLLGCALSINNLGCGFGAGLIHLSPLWTGAAAGGVSWICIWAGCEAGRRFGRSRLGAYSQVVAGCLLIAVGIKQLL